MRNFTDDQKLIQIICVTVKYMPLELKTGRASFSSEHKGQLIIYQMMMSQVGAPVDSGLLLYLREGVMKEIHGTHNERRDLLLLRNEMAYYLSFKNGNTVGRQETSSTEFNIPRIVLPEPISHRNACTSCPYNILCSVYLKQDNDMWSSLSKNHPLKEITPLVTIHLAESHIAYFCHWVGLLSLEQKESQKSMLIIRNIDRQLLSMRSSFQIIKLVNYGLIHLNNDRKMVTQLLI